MLACNAYYNDFCVHVQRWLRDVKAFVNVPSLHSAFLSLSAGEIIFSYLEPTLPPDLVFAKTDFNPDIDRLTVSRVK